MTVSLLRISCEMCARRSHELIVTNSLVCVWHDSFICLTWLLLNVSHHCTLEDLVWVRESRTHCHEFIFMNLFICVTRLLFFQCVDTVSLLSISCEMCERGSHERMVTNSYVWHDSFVMCDTVSLLSISCEMCERGSHELIGVCEMTHSYALHDSFLMCHTVALLSLSCEMWERGSHKLIVTSSLVCV